MTELRQALIDDTVDGYLEKVDEVIKTLRNEAQYRPTIWGDARPLLKEASEIIDEMKTELAEWRTWDQAQEWANTVGKPEGCSGLVMNPFQSVLEWGFKLVDTNKELEAAQSWHPIKNVTECLKHDQERGHTRFLAGKWDSEIQTFVNVCVAFIEYVEVDEDDVNELILGDNVLTYTGRSKGWYWGYYDEPSGVMDSHAYDEIEGLYCEYTHFTIIPSINN